MATERCRQMIATTGMAGVANTGMDRNWTGSHFDQANWYAFGRLAWDLDLKSKVIAEEWARMTISNSGFTTFRAERYAQVAAYLTIQEHEAQWWRDASITYFQSLSHRPLPRGLARPPFSLQYYESLCFPYAPGNPGAPSPTC